MMIHRALLLCFASLLVCVLPACQSAPTAEERSADRSKIDGERDAVLQKLYAVYPDAKKQMAEAYGSAVFSGTNVFVIFGGGSGAKGVAIDKAGKKTYMSMSEAGAKGFSIVCLFNNDLDYRNFTEKGWSFNARADAAAKGDSGGEAGNAANTSGVWKYYELTKDGVLLQAAVGVRKFWPEKHLND